MKEFKKDRVEITQEEQRQYRRLQTQKALVETLQRQLCDDREALQAKNASLKQAKEKAREELRLADARRVQLKEAQTEAQTQATSLALLEKAKSLQRTPDMVALIDVLLDINSKFVLNFS